MNQLSANMEYHGGVIDPLNQRLQYEVLFSMTHGSRNKEVEEAQFAIFSNSPVENFVLSIPAILASVELEVQVYKVNSSNTATVPGKYSFVQKLAGIRL